MKLNRAAIRIVTALSAAAPASAQVAADSVAEAGIPAGNIFAPDTPAGHADHRSQFMGRGGGTRPPPLHPGGSE